MNRAQVAAAVGARLGTILSNAGVLATDTTGNLKEPIDDALTQMGTEDADLATADVSDRVGFTALVKHRALLVVIDRLSASFDVSDQGSSFKLSQQMDHAKDALKRAEDELRVLFGSAYWPIADRDEITAVSVETWDLNYL